MFPHIFLLFIFALSFQVSAQTKAELNDCTKDNGVTVIDSRGFDDTRPIEMDLDDDGLKDKITPRLFTVKMSQTARSRNKTTEVHWIAFDLKTSRGQFLKSFFKYRYGTDEADYWIYHFTPCRLNRNGRTDLFFYSGDDTSQESIILANKGDRFRIYFRKIEDLVNQ